MFVATTLRRAGYEVSIAINGQEGLSRTMKLLPQCLILDILLPGMSGYALCRQLRRDMPDRPISIILTGSKDVALDADYGLRQGADRYLSKPFSEETLVQAVWEVLPEAYREAVLPDFSDTQKQRVITAFPKLIPRHIPNQETMRASNPFSTSPTIADEYARILYAATNGKRTVLELAGVTRLEMKEVTRALGLLLMERYIQMYNSQEQIVDTDLLLSALLK
jgi:twitching motility two-component system response regulator PilH